MKRNSGFKTFIAPEFGVFIFWLFAAALLVSAGISIAHGSLFGAVWSVVVVLVVRMVLEAMTILFSIHGVLVEIRDGQKRAEGPSSEDAGKAARDERLRRAREVASQQPKAAPGESRLEGF